MLSPRSRRQASKRRGIAVTELAVCLPVLTVIVIFAFEACSAMYLRQSLAIAAYEGARVAILPESQTSQAKYQTELILEDRGVHAFSVTVSPSVESTDVGTFIAVRAEAPCEANSILGSLFHQDRVVSKTVEMMKEY